MKPITFPEQNRVLKPAPGDEGRVLPLPVFYDGRQCLSCWELTDEELDYIVKNRRIWLSLCNGPNPPQPLAPLAQHPFAASPFCFRQVVYRPLAGIARSIEAWVGGDFTPPQLLDVNGIRYEIDERMTSQEQYPDKALGQDDYYFRMPTPEEVARRFALLLGPLQELPSYQAETERGRLKMEQELREDCLRQPVLAQRLQAGEEKVFE